MGLTSDSDTASFLTQRLVEFDLVSLNFLEILLSFLELLLEVGYESNYLLVSMVKRYCDNNCDVNMSWLAPKYSLCASILLSVLLRSFTFVPYCFPIHCLLPSFP